MNWLGSLRTAASAASSLRQPCIRSSLVTVVRTAEQRSNKCHQLARPFSVCAPTLARATSSLHSPRWVNPKNGQETDQKPTPDVVPKDEDELPSPDETVRLDGAEDGNGSESSESSTPPSSSSGSSSGSDGSDSSSTPPPESPPPPAPPASGTIAKQSVPEIYPEVLALPIARRPLFPGFYKAVVVRNPAVVAAIKEMMKRGQPYLGAFLLKDENTDSDVITDINSVHPVGVFAQITSVFAASGRDDDKEEGLTAVLYPHRRIKITDLVKAGGPAKVESIEDEPQTVTPPPSPSLDAVADPTTKGVFLEIASLEFLFTVPLT